MPGWLLGTSDRSFRALVYNTALYRFEWVDAVRILKQPLSANLHTVMVQHLDAKSIKPRQFWERFVSQRQPVVLNGIDKQWDQLTDELLLSKAGDVPVQVEHRTNNQGTYGQGRKSPMQFADFLKALQRGDSSLYMSTQEVGVGRDGHPLLLGPPLIQLQGHFPQQLQLMSHLVPHSINMWMGCAPQGSSSGLHHDFHDNMYVLLRGSKRFRLYSPSCVADMYVRGTVNKVYPNGRIVYEGQGDILPDGSDAHDVNLWRARHAADQAAALGDAGVAETVLEQQLEAMLEEETGPSVGWDLADDYVDSDDLAGTDSDDDLPLTGQQQNGKRKNSQEHPTHNSKKHKAAAVEVTKNSRSSKAASAVTSTAAEAAPASFSQVDLSLPTAELRRKFPKFFRVAAQEVVLSAGQMLYLPAGWFHEVTSFGLPGHDGGHLAINFWYHPPDNLKSSTASFKQPYTSQYYPTIWAQRRPWLQADTERWWQRRQRGKAAAPQAHATTSAAAAAGACQQQLSARVAEASLPHIHWRDEVHSPTNKYRMSMTRKGTASGDVNKIPSGSRPGNRSACGMMPGTDAAGDSFTDSPCSSGPDSAGTATVVEHQASVENNHLAADECSLRHLAASAGHNSPINSVVTPQHTQHTAKQHKQQQCFNNAVNQQQQGHGKKDSNSANNDDEGNLSEDVLAGIKAVEDYFSGNPAAAKQLLQEFLAQRRQRTAMSGRPEQTTLALPQLSGRRHHYSVAVRVVPRKPAKR